MADFFTAGKLTAYLVLSSVLVYKSNGAYYIKLQKGRNGMAKDKFYLSDNHKIRIDWIIFIFLFLAEMIYGIYLGYFREVLLGDAVSRTANAFYVLSSKPYRLTSMGLVWNPLPSFLQLPFVALSKWWRPFVTKGIGAAFITAFFAAWQGKRLVSTFYRLEVEKLPAVILTLLFCLNPYIFFYGANGMSEIIFMAFLVQIVCAFSLWIQKGAARYLITVAAGFVGLFLTRYEAIPFALSVGMGMCLQIFFSKQERQFYPAHNWKEPVFYLEGSLWVTFFPVIFTALVWISYNWSITGNPFYFMNSGYSMNAYSAYYTDYVGFTGAVGFVWVRLWPFLLLFFTLLLIRILTKTVWRVDFLILCVVSLGLTVFQFFMIANGKSGGYVRYLCYVMVLAMAWVPYQLSVLQKKQRKIASFFLAVVLLVSTGYFTWAFRYSSLMREDTLLSVPAKSEQVAQYINSNLKHDRILMDSYRTYYIIMNVDYVDRLVISSSPDFKESVEDPAAHNIDYLIVPQIGSYGNMDSLNIAYPNLYQNGEDWCQEVASIGEFKIYKVLS